jgi:ubiquinol-cytochrome c reductase cytochrome b subunit
VKDGFAIAVFLLMFAAFVFYNPNALGHPDNYIPANPLVTPAHIVPEWYFLPFYAILRAVPDKLGGVALMGSAILVLFVLPWLDTSKVRSLRFRPFTRILFLLWTVNFFVLMWVGGKPAEQPYVMISQICTALYFAYFLVVLPLMGRLERPMPLPESIARAVLGAKASLGGGPIPGGAAAKPMEKA